jgi:hypothetical protein
MSTWDHSSSSTEPDKNAINAKLKAEARIFWLSETGIAANKELVSLLSDSPVLLTNLKAFAEKHGIPGKKAFFEGNSSIETKRQGPTIVWCGLTDKDETYWNRTEFNASGQANMPSRVHTDRQSQTLKKRPFKLNLLFDEVVLKSTPIKYLKEIAQKETWTISPRHQDGVLWQYLKLTYARLEQQGKLFKRNDCIMFNTGLFDNEYNPIYAYLARNNQNDTPDKKPWVCIRFAGRDDSLMRKHLPHDLQPAKWFDSTDELFFDPDKTVFPNFEHCMLENAIRLPRSLFERSLADKEEFHKLTSFFDALEKAEKNEDFYHVARDYGIGLKQDELETNAFRDPTQILSKGFLQNLPEFKELKRKLSVALDAAIQLAKKMVISDYAAAVPTFYPKDNSFALMLPLSFDDPLKIDCALVVVRNENGAYEGKTILTTGMAYTNARILRKPDAHWLTQYFEQGYRM